MNIKEKLSNLKPVDYIIVTVIIFIIAVGILVLFGKNKFSKSPVEETRKIAFQVTLRSISITDKLNPFRIGDDAFITIRNVPYTKLQIIDAQIMPKKAMLPIPNGKDPYTVVDDQSQPFLYDAIVSLIDDAKITNDGAVVGGNKIKIGVPIVLEGYNYRIGGTVSNVEILNDIDLIKIHKYIETSRQHWAEQNAEYGKKALERRQKEAAFLEKVMK